MQPDEHEMTAFVFKIQANMDPNHRDRIAFARICSGKLERGMKARLSRTGKQLGLTAPQFFFASQRQLADDGLCRRRGRHSQSRHAPDRRYADGGRGRSSSRACRISRRKSCAASASKTR